MYGGKGSFGHDCFIYVDHKYHYNSLVNIEIYYKLPCKQVLEKQ